MSSSLDDLLHKHLAAGDETNPEAPELDPLLQLASSIQQLPHPQPTIDQARAWRVAMLKELDGRTQGGFPMSTLRKIFTPPVARISILAVIAALVLIITFPLLSSPNSVAAAALINPTGLVSITTGDGQTWHTASVNDGLIAGMHLQTGDNSTVTLMLPDGSQILVAGSTEIKLSELSYNNQTLQVEIIQTSGQTTHSVVPLTGKDSFYSVSTPSGKASVRGTIFQVSVDTTGQSFFAVDTGEVLVTNVESTVKLTSGTATLVYPNQPPLPPLSYFTLNDRLLSIDGNEWTVGTTIIWVSDETVIQGDPVIGSMLYIVGRILPNETWLADFITLEEMEPTVYEFTGEVQLISDTSWQIADLSFMINEVTEIEDEITLGDTVKVTYIILIGDRWLALKIERLDDDEQETPEPIETTEPPEETPTETSEPDHCTGTEIHPYGQELANRYGVAYAEIMNWFCKYHFGFGEIDLAYSLSLKTGLPVAEIFAMRQQGKGWGLIMNELAPRPGKTPPIGKPKDLPVPPQRPNKP